MNLEHIHKALKKFMFESSGWVVRAEADTCQCVEAAEEIICVVR